MGGLAVAAGVSVCAGYTAAGDYGGVAPQGPELVAVNGRPVVGTSGYWRELRRYEELAEKSGPFVLSLRRADGTVVEKQPIFGNCTCGKMTDLKALWYAMLPPVVMILVGLAGVLLWVLLALALGAAQMSLVPDGISTFRGGGEIGVWGHPAFGPRVSPWV